MYYFTTATIAATNIHAERINLYPVPSINPTNDHRAALNAWRRVKRLIAYSPINAPTIGKMIIPNGGTTKIPINNPIVDQIIPRFVHQYFLVHRIGR